MSIALKKCLPLAIGWIVLCNFAKSQDPLEHPYASMAQSRVTKFLELAREIHNDYACWMDMQEVGYFPESDGLFDATSINVFARNAKASWTFYGECRGGGGVDAITSPNWMQYLKHGEKRFERMLGVAGRGKHQIEQDGTTFDCPIINASPIFRPLVDRITFIEGRASEAHIAGIFLNTAIVKQASYTERENDFVVVWSLPGEGLDVEMQVVFRKSWNYLPSRSTYTSIEGDKRRVFDVTQTEWDKIDGKWLPTRMRTAYESSSGLTHFDGTTELTWRVGPSAPDDPPVNEGNDWRVKFCKLFERKCYADASSAESR